MVKLYTVDLTCYHGHPSGPTWSVSLCDIFLRLCRTVVGHIIAGNELSLDGAD